MAQINAVARNGQPLTMDPPGYVDIKKCKDEDDGAKDRGNYVLKSRGPKGCFWRGLLRGEGGVHLGAVVGLDVRRRRWWGRQRYFATP